MISSTAISISPVASFGLIAEGARATTWPLTVTTVSSRSDSTVLKCALPAAITHWVRP